MAKHRLTEQHPLTQKVQKVEELMNELGIQFSFNEYGNVYVTDGKIEAQMLDLDSGGRVDTIPYWCETKLVRIEED